MRDETAERVREVRTRRFARQSQPDEERTTKQMHNRLLRALSDRRDRRFRRALDS
jgi:hypothetical protein